MIKVLIHIRYNKSEIYFIISRVTTKEKKKCITTKQMFLIIKILNLKGSKKKIKEEDRQNKHEENKVVEVNPYV